MVQLSRQSAGEPWGFRLQGGRDYRQQLCVKKVSGCETVNFYYRKVLRRFISVVGAATVEWLSSWLAEQEVRGSIPRLAT